MNSRRYFGLFAALTLSALSTAFAGSATWKTNPSSGDWNKAANWRPATVPNGAADVASFGSSATTDVSLSTATEVSGIVFNAGASAFTITSTPTDILTISGPGIMNDSGVVQTLVADMDESGTSSGFRFINRAKAGRGTAFIMIGGDGTFGTGGETDFVGNSSADSAVFDIFGTTNGGFTSGGVRFFQSSTAAKGTFNFHHGGDMDFNQNATASHASFKGPGGVIYFFDDATADYATFSDTATVFRNSSSAGHCVIQNTERLKSDFPTPNTEFTDTATAEDATIINDGGTASGSIGGVVEFGSGTSGTPSAGNATLIANGGSGGGKGGLISFSFASDGGTARIELFGNGTLDIASHQTPGVTVGSIEGDGVVILGARNLSVGSNHLSTTFAGLIKDGTRATGGSLTKTGSDALVLTSGNTYSGGTTLKGSASNNGFATLEVDNPSGSGTGSGPVTVLGGALRGIGTIAGAVTTTDTNNGPTISTILAPGRLGFAAPGTLTIRKALTINSGTYYVAITDTNASLVVARGVTLGSSASIRFTHLPHRGQLPPGTVFTLISNIAASPIAGTFLNLRDGQAFTKFGNTYAVNYEGGDGNDLTLTVVP